MVNTILDEIKKSLDNECFMAALTMALTLPDICGKAEYPNEKSTKKRYIDWYTEYIGQFEKPPKECGENLPYSSGEIVYSLRCFILHQGTPAIDAINFKEERCKVDQFILTIDDALTGAASNASYSPDLTVVHRALEVNLVNLCTKLLKTVRWYYDNNRDKFDFLHYEIQDRRNGYWDI